MSIICYDCDALTDAGLRSIVLATGYHKPSVDMLPRDLFPTEGARNYERPNLYLQVSPTAFDLTSVVLM